jgi:3-deoxy-D-manno-octulosonic-acid transferase
LRVADADALVAALAALLSDPGRRQAMGLAARAFHALHRGAADRLWEWLAPQLAAARPTGLSRRARR